MCCDGNFLGALSLKYKPTCESRAGKSFTGSGDLGARDVRPPSHRWPSSCELVERHRVREAGAGLRGLARDGVCASFAAAARVLDGREREPR